MTVKELKTIKESNVILTPKSEFGRQFVKNHGNMYNIYPTKILSSSQFNLRIESIKDREIILVSSDNDSNKDFIVKFQ